MPQQVMTSVENNFTKGLITEATGLNFPENAATSASNCIFTLIGDLIRREGFNFEANGTTTNINRTLLAMSSYVWRNPGGDGNSELLVKQVGSNLYFYNVAVATTTNPISTQLLGTTISISQFVVSGVTFDATQECTYADGNGYLFVYHPNCDPFAVIYNPTSLALSTSSIALQVRDFQGINDNLPAGTRPLTLSAEHQYNLANQGWTTSPPWSISNGQCNNASIVVGTQINFTVPSGISGIVNGVVVKAVQFIQGFGQGDIATGTVVSYTGTTLIVNCLTISGMQPPNFANSFWNITPVTTGYVNTWFTAEGNYPSNSDVWFLFKDSTGAFNPATTAPNVQFTFGLAPKGHFVLPAFILDRTAVSTIQGLTPVTTSSRPTNGAWFAGRVWYTGVNASFPATGDANAYTWTENIYFSQIIQDTSQFGLCYQNQDPTAQTSAGLLATDGGTIVIVGSGTIQKLFPIANGLLVFANNGIWFITGSQGIGFSPTDFTITKISSVRALSNKSFIDVLGLPYFWNEEGIYQIVQGQGGQLQVQPLTVGTILTYYSNIPLQSKKFARGSYDPINYTLQWCFRSTQESTVTDRYQFDSVLNYNTFNHAFFPYNLSTGSNTQFIHDVKYISFPIIGATTPLPNFWYPCSQLVTGVYQHGLAQEYDPLFQDWGSVLYTSTVTTGFKLHGQAWRKWQIPYLFVYSRNNGYAAYYLSTVWDYAGNFNQSKITNAMFTEINEANTTMAMRRHKIRGRGRALQFQFTSVPNQPFDIMGWSAYENVNTSV